MFIKAVDPAKYCNLDLLDKKNSKTNVNGEQHICLQFIGISTTSFMIIPFHFCAIKSLNKQYMMAGAYNRIHNSALN